jgi:uncharacterized protein YwqG
METGLMIALGISLIIGILLIMFNSVPAEATKYKKAIEYVHFEQGTLLTEDELRRRLSLLQLDKYGSELQSLIKHEITVKLIPCEDKAIEKGNSKTGGFPHLPCDVQIHDGFLFLSQINCAQIKPLDKDNLFPSEGILYFFIHPQKMKTDIKDAVMVYYTPSTHNLIVRNDVSPLPCLKVALMQFYQTVSLPEYDAKPIEDLLKDYEIDGYFKLTNRELYHKITGYPNPITQPFPLNNDKILLLQLDSDDAVGMQWNDMGRLYLLIDKFKLCSLQFNALDVYIQSYRAKKE